jgi:hypothetical protein
MMKKMLQGKSMLDEYWAEAMNRVIYLLNRSPDSKVPIML